MPVPFFANTTDDPAVLPAQRGVSDVLEMAESASLKIVGIGSVDVETQRVKSGMIERFEIEAVSNAGGIGELPGAEVLVPAVTNQALVRFLDPSGQDHDAFTDRVIGMLQAEGTAFFGGTAWSGARAMRISVCSWRTTPDDVELTIDAVRSVLAEAVRCSKGRVIIFEDVYFSPWQWLFVVWNDFYTNILFGAVRVMKGEAGKGLLSIPMPLTFRSVKGWQKLFKTYPVTVKDISIRHAKHKPHSKAVFCLEVTRK